MSNSTEPRATRTRQVRRVTVLVAAAVAATLLAGCAGSDSIETASMRSQARPDSGAADPGETPDEPDGGSESGGSGGGGEGSGGTTPGNGGNSGGGGGDSDEFCRQLRTFSEQSDPDDVAVVIDWLKDLRDSAPSDLQDDFDVMIGMIERLETVDESDPEALGEVFETLLDPAVQEASNNVAGYASEECGIDLNGEIDLQPGGG